MRLYVCILQMEYSLSTSLSNVHAVYQPTFSVSSVGTVPKRRSGITRSPEMELGHILWSSQWRQREFKVGGTSLVSRLSACLTEAIWWRLITE